MKIVMIYDQIQSGKGIKDDHMVPLGLVKESCGPAIMMEPFLKQVNGHVVCCLYCGDGFYEANSDEVSRKLCAMVEKSNQMLLYVVHVSTILAMGAWLHVSLMILTKNSFTCYGCNEYRK